MTRLALIPLAVAALLLPAATASAQGGDFEHQVVGGYQVSAAQFPWQAAVVDVPTKNPGSDFDRQYCGGSLVTSRIVLTAAHCVFDTDPDCARKKPIPVPCTPLTDPPPGDGTALLDPDDVLAILGRTTLSNEAQGVEHTVIDVDHQDDYNPNFNPPFGVPQNDVGYLVLSDTPATSQPPIKIAAGGVEPSLWAPGVFVDITGWGSTFSGGSHVDTLRGGSVPMVSDGSCAASYGGDFDQASMVCAGYADGGVDTCQGDSGGPLESPLLGGGYRLVGITSWGIGCASPGFPGVYARVAEPTLAAAIEAEVTALETANTLPDETVIGNGTGQPRGGITFPKQAQPPDNDVALPPTVLGTAQPKDPFAKCRKIRKKTKKQRKKRKACMTKVRKSL